MKSSAATISSIVLADRFAKGLRAFEECHLLTHSFAQPHRRNQTQPLECDMPRRFDVLSSRARRRWKSHTNSEETGQKKEMGRSETKRGLAHRIRKLQSRRSREPELLAPRAGLEPATLRLTAGCSTIELSRNDFKKCVQK